MLPNLQFSSLLILPLFLQLVGLTFAVAVDNYINSRQRRVMLTLVGLVFCLIIQNYMEYGLDILGNKPYARIVTGIVGYSIRPLIIVLFMNIIKKEYRIWQAWVLVGINTAIHLTALFSDICFTVDADNSFQRGPLGYSCHIISAILLCGLMYLTIREFRETRKMEALIPLMNVLFIIVSVLADSMMGGEIMPVSYLTITVVNSSMFYYIWLHLQFVRQHEKALMAEQRIQIMMSQIQPHFLFNTLSTIQALCHIDPDKAFDTIEKFGVYLRQNIDSLSQPNLIPVKKELEHTRVYVEIEEIRFPDIRIEHDIRDLDFRVPALTIQPLVENAIRHGIRGREDGTVFVSTREVPGYHEIEIRDNGKGFDPNTVEKMNGTHIGIWNVQERVKKMCGGTVKINSKIGEGTTIVIRIPLG